MKKNLFDKFMIFSIIFVWFLKFPTCSNVAEETTKSDLNEFKTVGELITQTIKGLSENPTDNSKIENEVKNEVISLTSSFPIYKNL